MRATISPPVQLGPVTAAQNPASITTMMAMSHATGRIDP